MGWVQDLRRLLANTGRARDYCPEHAGLASVDADASAALGRGR